METETLNLKINTEKISFSSVVRNGRTQKLKDRLKAFSAAMDNQEEDEQHQYFRTIESATDRLVKVTDRNRKTREMLMFGSNNYLGLANHPYIIQKINESIHKYGVGIAGPPLLNGYSRQMAELEERLSHLKGTEETLIFSSGYNANLGLVTGVCNRNDLIIADEYCHASFYDGTKLLKGKCQTFHHNNLAELENLLKKADTTCDIFVAVEGVYSMDGDLAPLDEIVKLCKNYGAVLLLDDAHGTGVLGPNGEGTLKSFGLKWSNEIILGTFSKTFTVNGGFISGSSELINYLRFMSRSYMFSASLPPVTIAAVLAALDVLENEPWRRPQLLSNVKYLTYHLNKFGLAVKPEAGIIALNVPEYANIRKMANQFNKRRIFLNAVEFPAVPLHKQRFRISVSANHTHQDLDNLISTIEEIWFLNSLDY